MKASELRIGNLVIRDGNILEVVRISKEDVINYELFKECIGQQVNSGVVKPIPLTEEWLLKFGFEKDERVTMDSYQIRFKQHCYRAEKFLSDIKPKNTYDFRLQYTVNESYYLSSIRYLHQLQNLYFALTGEELKLNGEA